VTASDVVITGLGVVSPIGIGAETFWQAICEGRSGIGRIGLFDPTGLPVEIAAEVRDFVAKDYVDKAMRKSLKVMCRDAQLGVAACTSAARESGIQSATVDPDRFGIILGADRICTPQPDSESTYRACIIDGQFDFARWGTEGMAATPPLSFLTVLPNMIASHVSIALDARGPNNTIHHGEVSSLLAIAEAASVIQRGMADVMIAGGASSQMNPIDCARRCAQGILSARQDEPARAMRPFDAGRNGQVWGEGAAVFVLEGRRHAEARGAKIFARILGWASACEAMLRENHQPTGSGLRHAVRLALQRAAIDGDSDGVGHINAHGVSMPCDDRTEAQVLNELLAGVPVTAPKSYFGNLGAASGAMEMAASVLGIEKRLVPPTLNYEQPDPECPVEVVAGEPASATAPSALSINATSAGQAVGVVLGSPG